MPTIKELLGDLSTPEIEKALEGKDLAVINDGSYVPKAKFSESANEVKELRKQLTERDTQLEDLKTKAAGNEALQRQIDDLKEANTKTTQAFETQLKEQAKEFAIDKAIAESQGKNPKAIKALLDLGKVSVDGENILGLKEQLDAIKTSDAYLFGETKPVGSSTNPAGGGNNATDLQAKYDLAIKEGRVAEAIAIKNEMFGVK